MKLFQCDGCGKVMPARVLGDGDSLPPLGWQTREIVLSGWQRGAAIHACTAECVAESRRRVAEAHSLGALSLSPLPLLSCDFRSAGPGILAPSLLKFHGARQNGQDAPSPMIADAESTNLAEQDEQDQCVESTYVHEELADMAVDELLEESEPWEGAEAEGEIPGIYPKDTPETHWIQEEVASGSKKTPESSDSE